MKSKHLRRLIIAVLYMTDLHSESAVNLLMGTAAQESHMGLRIYQMNDGPARGFFQMEPTTEQDIWKNYIRFKPDLKSMMHRAGFRGPDKTQLTGNLIYQIIMARLHYLRIPKRLPPDDDVMGMAQYWKKHYNTHKGRGKILDFIQNYGELAL